MAFRKLFPSNGPAKLGLALRIRRYILRLTEVVGVLGLKGPYLPTVRFVADIVLDADRTPKSS